MRVFERPKKGSGHWYVDIYINGKKKTKVIKEARTRRQAEQAALVIQNEVFEKRYGNGGNKNFRAFVEESYLPHAKATKKSYVTELPKTKFLMKEFGDKRLIDITPKIIEELKIRRASEISQHGRTRKKRSVDLELAALSSIFTLAVQFDEIKENPCRRVKLYNQNEKRERVVSPAEEIKIFEIFKDDLAITRIATVLLYTGLRRKELYNLQWRDVDFEKGEINLRFGTTKTDKPRMIPMFPNVREVFESMRGEFETVDPKQLIFTFPSMNGLSIKFSRKLKENNLLGITIHILRHTFSTRLNEFGVDVFAHKALMGHSRVDMTSHYTHLQPESLKSSLDVWKQDIINKKDTNLRE